MSEFKHYENNNPYSYQGYSKEQKDAQQIAPKPDYNYYTSQNQNESDELKTSSFYSERYQKPRKSKLRDMILPLLIVALLSSVIGGGLVGAWFQFGAPAVAEKNHLPNNGNALTHTTKQIEIISSTESPATAIAEKVSPSIVGIQVNYVTSNLWFGSQQASGSGSGIIIRSDGYILTNNHVIEAAIESGNRVTQGSSIQIILPNQMDKSYDATIVGRDERTDIAILKVNLSELPAVDIGNSDDVKVGELAIAIGNPAGLEFMGSVTQGIISGVNRQIQLGAGKPLKVLQTDAAINPGNSGGALVNSNGEVIGVNTVKIGGSNFEGLGFAIPINTAIEIADNLIADGYVKGRPQLGVSIDTRFNQEWADQLGVPMGLLVGDVFPLTSAYNAGVKTGDIITEFNGEAVTSFDELEEEKNKYLAGDTITLKVYRIEGSDVSKGKYLELDLVLGEDKG